MATVTATAEATNVPPRVSVSIAASDLSPVPASVTVQREDPDGKRRTVRGAGPLTLSGGVGALFDYEAPFGSAVRYRYTVAGTTYRSSPVTLSVPDVWLRHPTAPALSLKVELGADFLTDLTRPLRTAVFRPLGRRDPIVVSSGQRSTGESTLTLRTSTLEALASLWNILEDGQPLLLSVPASFRYGLLNEWLAIGDVREQRFGTWAGDEDRALLLPFIIVAAPAGDVQAVWTYASVLAARTTNSDVDASYATYLDLLTAAA